MKEPSLVLNVTVKKKHVAEINAFFLDNEIDCKRASTLVRKAVEFLAKSIPTSGQFAEASKEAVEESIRNLKIPQTSTKHTINEIANIVVSKLDLGELKEEK